MPKLVSLYIRNVAIGFALAGAFVAILVWFDVAHLRHLIFGSDMGLVALAMLVVANGVIFAGVQFAIAVMSMAERDDTPGGGLRAPAVVPVPVPVQATAPSARRRLRR
ncbi:MAG: hypothetical protein IE927_08295 [Rhodobacterales bacterium]|nr:hypothetical protein [Rhodobacterales bacterium]